MNDKIEALVYQARLQHEQGKTLHELLDFLAQKDVSFIDALLVMHEVLPHHMAQVQKAFTKHEHWAPKQQALEDKHERLSHDIADSIAH